MHSIVIYSTNAKGERELFERVQCGMPLTTAGMVHHMSHVLFTDALYLERLRMVSSPMGAWIRSIDDVLLKGVHGLDRRLYRDEDHAYSFQCMVMIVWFCQNLPTKPGPPTFRVLDSWLNGARKPDDTFATRMINALLTMYHIVNDPNHNAAFMLSYQLAPVEFVFAGTYIYP